MKWSFQSAINVEKNNNKYEKQKNEVNSYILKSTFQLGKKRFFKFRRATHLENGNFTRQQKGITGKLSRQQNKREKFLM